MSEPFLGQIIATGFGYAPPSYARCDGQIMSISQNNALFSLLGVIYGGDGNRTFGLPDMRGRYPLGSFPSADGAWQPPTTAQGALQGVENVVLVESQIPPHSHLMGTSSAAGVEGVPADQIFASALIYAPSGNLTPLGGGPMSPSGMDPHPNVQPSLVIGFSIALSGLFPSRS